MAFEWAEPTTWGPYINNGPDDQSNGQWQWPNFGNYDQLIVYADSPEGINGYQLLSEIPEGWNFLTQQGYAEIILPSGSARLEGEPSHTWSFTIRAYDYSGATDEKTYTYTVVEALRITNPDIPGAPVEEPYGYQLESPYPDATYSSPNLPDGMTLTPGGVLEGTPTTPGTYPVDIVITSPSSGQPPVTTTPVITVGYPPVITKPSEGEYELPNGAPGEAYSFKFTADGDKPITWSATDLPAGMTMSSTGVLSGSPSEPLSSSIVVTAKNKVKSTAGYYSINFLDPNPIQVQNTSDLPVASVGVPYSFQLQISGGVAPYSVTTTPGYSLPSWVSVSSSGLISGTPTQAGGFNDLPLTITDSSGLAYRKIQRVFSIRVILAGAPVITTSGYIANIENYKPWSFQLQATGNQPMTWTLHPDDLLPEGITLSSTGLLSGTTELPDGVANVRVKAQNSVASDTVGVQFGITDTRPIIVTTVSLPRAAKGQPYSTRLTATGGKLPYTWEPYQIPDWLSVSEDGVLSGTVPDEVQDYFVFIYVSDSVGRSVGTSWNLNVTDGPQPGDQPDDEEWLSVYGGTI